MREICQVMVTGQNQVELQDALLDDRPLDADELLIETEATFISAGTELANYTGKEPKVFHPGNWCSYPWKSGYANVGMVQAVGANVMRVKVGERVFCYGNHASLVRYNQRRLVIPVPAGIHPVLAAASRMAGVAMTSIIVSEIRDNPWVAVFGLGTVGNLAAQMFRIRGCRVIGIDPVDYRRQLAESCGIEITIGGNPQAAHEQIMAMTGGKGADITVDAVGHSAVVMQAVKATASHGQLVILGSPRVPVEGNLTELLADVHLRWVTLRGALEWCVPMYPEVGSRTSQWSKQETIFDWMERGLLQIEPLVSHRLPPTAIQEAYEGLLHQPEMYTGVALVWQ